MVVGRRVGAWGAIGLRISRKASVRSTSSIARLFSAQIATADLGFGTV